jgi:hypothetical protein
MQVFTTALQAVERAQGPVAKMQFPHSLEGYP